MLVLTSAFRSVKILIPHPQTPSPAGEGAEGNLGDTPRPPPRGLASLDSPLFTIGDSIMGVRLRWIGSPSKERMGVITSFLPIHLRRGAGHILTGAWGCPHTILIIPPKEWGAGG